MDDQAGSGDEQKLSQYSHERGLKIAMEIDNLFKGRNTYENSVSACDSQGDLRKAIEEHQRDLKI